MIERDFNGFPIPVPAPPAPRKKKIRRPRRGLFGGRAVRPGLKLGARIERGLARLPSGRPYSLRELAEACRVSECTIAEIERSALRKLRVKLDPQELRELRLMIRA